MDRRDIAVKTGGAVSISARRCTTPRQGQEVVVLITGEGPGVSTQVERQIMKDNRLLKELSLLSPRRGLLSWTLRRVQS